MKRTFSRHTLILPLVYCALGIAGIGQNACSVSDSTLGIENPETCPPGSDPAACTESAANGTGGGGGVGGDFGGPKAGAADGTAAR